jgi:hypothetical protein
VSRGRPIFTIRGLVAYADLAPARAFVAVVDADPDLDDLIAVGTCEPDGSFRVSFTTEAFNQEPGEAEERPDVYVVVSILDAGTPVPVLHRAFGKLEFANAEMEEDLGILVLTLREGERPPPGVGLERLRAAPGRGKVVKRLRLDEELVAIAAREVVAHVEQLTGWSGLLDGVRFEILDGFHDMQRARVERLLGRGDFGADELARLAAVARDCDAGIAAQWDPFARVVQLNRPALERQSFDYLKLTLGHELVHAGQSRARPDLDTWVHANQAESWKHLLAGTEKTVEARREAGRFMANVEGYAFYIEEMYLRRIYTHGTELAQVTTKADARFRAWEQRRTVPEPPPKSVDEAIERVEWSKTAQYRAGCAAYLMRTKGDRPAPFDGDLRPEVEPIHLELAEVLIAVQELARK